MLHGYLWVKTREATFHPRLIHCTEKSLNGRANRLPPGGFVKNVVAHILTRR